MPENVLPNSVRRFILTSIPSVLQLEVLLHVFAARPRFIGIAKLSQELGIDAEPLEAQLREMSARGLVSSQTSGPPGYAYLTTDAERDAAVTQLAAMYPHYRVSIIHLIYSRPADNIQRLADAFRLTDQTGEAKHE